MINEDIASSVPVEKTDAQFKSQNFDDSDEESVHSHYSSFGDSEFEKYCSANSVMGTPSLCSSIGTFQESGDLDFGSIGDLNNSIESFRLEGEFSRSFRERRLSSSSGSVSFPGKKIENCKRKNSFEGKDAIEERGVIGINDEFSLYEDLNNVLVSVDANIPGVESNVQTVENHLPKLQSHYEIEFEREERENCSDEENTSSRFGHSDGEDSMFGYGTDNDQKLEAFNQKNLQLYKEPMGGKINNILMNSSIAFGSDDWDDFAQETRQLDINPMFLDKRLPSLENEKEDLNRAKNTFSTPVNVFETKQSEDTENMLITKEDSGVLDDLANSPENQADSNVFTIEHNPLSERSPFKKELNTKDNKLRERTQPINIQDISNVDGNRVSVGQESDYSMLQADPPPITVSKSKSVSTNKIKFPEKNFFDEKCFPETMDQNYTKPLQDLPASLELFQSHQKPVKTDNVDLHDFCDELVHEMEEILLDSAESSRPRFTHSDLPSQTNSPLPLRDGGLTASTSATNYTYPLNQQTHKIDLIEVIGAKQRKGDVSFSERLVGVKEYTVYVIKVQSGNDHWEVERRYRDFCTLYRRLKTIFNAQGLVLPPPWSLVERESRKIFGNVSPDVVRERSDIIQDCLRSILSHHFPPTFPNALIWFLSPQKDFINSTLSNTHDSQSPLSGSSYIDSKMIFGKTISLVVEMRPYKSIKQILEAQNFTCAGCHKHFDDGKTRVLEFVQTLGWGKPRRCEYSGQLFCATCHTNEIAVLPARVLHHWDFTLYPVSQMAKSYLDSIHDKPMLCVSAVNPFLFSKVPALQQVTGVRKRIGVMLPYVRCPFRMSIFKGLASRRYLLESNDFFALRDLIDLSKGAFAALPVMVDTVSRKILEHITEQCLVCCDVGIPCNARQACNDPSALIFPFQEGEIERCRSCKSVFHKHCFGKIPKCPCGESLRVDGEKGYRAKSEINSTTLDLFGRNSDSKSTMGFITGLFTKAKPRKLGSNDGDTIIPMGSLPSTSL